MLAICSPLSQPSKADCRTIKPSSPIAGALVPSQLKHTSAPWSCYLCAKMAQNMLADPVKDVLVMDILERQHRLPSVLTQDMSHTLKETRKHWVHDSLDPSSTIRDRPNAPHEWWHAILSWEPTSHSHIRLRKPSKYLLFRDPGRGGKLPASMWPKRCCKKARWLMIKFVGQGPKI